MNLFQLISRYFWLICLAIAGYNYVVGTSYAKKLAYPQENDAAVSLRRWFGIAAALPWIVMGYGEFVGKIPSIWYYLRPQDGDPYVSAWFGLIFFEAVVFAYWVFYCDGAEKSVTLQPFVVVRPRGIARLTVRRVKFFAALGPVWIVLCAFLVALMNAQIPK